MSKNGYCNHCGYPCWVCAGFAPDVIPPEVNFPPAMPQLPVETAINVTLTINENDASSSNPTPSSMENSRQGIPSLFETIRRPIASVQGNSGRYPPAGANRSDNASFSEAAHRVLDNARGNQKKGDPNKAKISKKPRKYWHKKKN